MHPVGDTGLRQPAAEQPVEQRAGVGHRCRGDDASGQTDRRTHGPPAQQHPTALERSRVIGFVEDLVNIVVVLAECDRAVRCHRGRQLFGTRPIRRHQNAGAAAQHFGAGRFDRSQQPSRVGFEPVAEPAQVRHHTDQGAAACSQRHGSKCAAQELGLKFVHRRPRLLGRTTAVEPVGQRGADPCGEVAQFGARARWEEEQRGRHADQQRQQPAQQAFVQRPQRGADRQQEDHEHGALPPGDDLAEQAQEAHQRAHRETEQNRDPRIRRCPGAQCDQDRAVDRQAAVGQGPGGQSPGEVRRDQQRHRADEGEQRGPRVAGEEVADHCGDRYGDGRTQRAAQSVIAWIAGVQASGDPLK